MAQQILLNNVSTKLTAAVAVGDTTINVTAGDGALFAAATGGDWIIITVAKISGFKEIAWEIMKATARSTDALTVIRAQEGTTALTFAIGDVVSVRLTAGGRVYANAGPDESPLGDRNKIPFGNFTTNPWQRGTTFTALANAGFGPDRFNANYATAGVVDWLKTADSPTASEAGIYSTSCLHLDVTTEDASIAATDQYAVLVNLIGDSVVEFGFGQAGTRYVTLSFWVKSTKTGKFYCSLMNSASNRAYCTGYTVNASDTWEKKTLTFPVDTSGTWLYDTGVGLRVRWTLMAGTTFHTTADAWQAGNYRCASDQVNALDSASNNFKLALIKLESGQQATPFESLDAGAVKRICRRTTRIQDFYVPATTAQNLGVIDMRATPTITGGGAGFTSTGTTADQLIAFQTTGAVATLTLVSEP